MFMDNMFLTTIISSATALFGFWYGVKKDKADLVSKSLTNIQSQIMIYQSIIDNLREEIELLIIKIEAQQKTIQELETMVGDMVKKRTKAKVD